MTDTRDVNCSCGNVNNDDSDDELIINFFENEASKYGIDEDSDFSNDSSALSDDGSDAGHTILKKESRCLQKQYIPNAGDIIVKKEGSKHRLILYRISLLCSAVSVHLLKCVKKCQKF
eukprot:3083395-Ditylum_brightwellii.AAC.1